MSNETETTGVKLTLATLINSQPALTKLVQAPVPARLAYRLLKIYETAATEIQRFHTANNALIEKHGEEVNGQSIVKQDSPKWAAFEAEHNDLCGLEVSLAIETLELADIEAVTLSGSDIQALAWLIKE